VISLRDEPSAAYIALLMAQCGTPPTSRALAPSDGASAGDETSLDRDNRRLTTATRHLLHQAGETSRSETPRIEMMELVREVATPKRGPGDVGVSGCEPLARPV
jgi:hypothetical protein